MYASAQLTSGYFFEVLTLCRLKSPGNFSPRAIFRGKCDTTKLNRVIYQYRASLLSAPRDIYFVLSNMYVYLCRIFVNKCIYIRIYIYIYIYKSLYMRLQYLSLLSLLVLA